MESRRSLIPPLVMSTFDKVMKWSRYCGASPFQWDSKQRRIRTSRSPFQILQFASNVFGLNLYLFYLITLLIHSISTGQQMYWIFRNLVLFLGVLTPSLTFIYCILKEREIVAWLNLVLKLDAWFSNVFLDDKFKPLEMSQHLAILYSISYFGRLYGLGAFLFALVWPDFPFFFIKLLPPELHHPLLTVVQACTIAYYVFALAGMLLTITGMFSIFGIVYFEIHHELQLKARKGFKYRSYPFLRTMDGIIIVYQSVKLLWNHVNSWSREFVMPIQMLIIRSVQVCNFAVIKYHGSLTLVEIPMFIAFSAMFGGGWLVIVQLIGICHVKSKSLIGSFRNLQVSNSHEKKIWKRFRKSLKPITVNVGDFYGMNSKTSLNVLSAIIWGTARLLILLSAH